jgi:hypothetical protein
MELACDPFPLIFAQGDEPTRLVTLLLFDLEDSSRARRCLLEVIKQQHANGTFPSQLDAELWGMRETVRNALLLLKVGLPPEGINVDSAVRLILSRQRPDGGWSENPALETPPEQTWLSTERSVLWLSADVVDLLRQVGREESPACRRALEWLRTTQRLTGGWPSLSPGIGYGEEIADDPDTTAQITFLIGELCGEDDPAYLKGRHLFETYLDKCAQDAERGYWVRLRDGAREELDVYHLTHLLLSWLLDPPRRLESGYDASDPRVRRMLETLIDLQREDGGWRPFFAQKSSPLYTALAVRVLVLSGMLERQALRPYVLPHSASPDPESL